jgi:hypothetical protein
MDQVSTRLVLCSMNFTYWCVGSFDVCFAYSCLMLLTCTSPRMRTKTSPWCIVSKTLRVARSRI